jgi:hypothetical protein
MDKGDQRRPIVLNAEVLQLKVALGLVIRVRLQGKIIRANRHPAKRKPRTRQRIEQLPQNTLAILFSQLAERSPSPLIETPAKSPIV